MSQSIKAWSGRKKILETKPTKTSLRIPKTASKPKKNKKTKRIYKSKQVIRNLRDASKPFNFRAKRKFWAKPNFKKKKRTTLSKYSQSQKFTEFSIPMPHVLVQSQSVKIPMLDYSSSVEDPQESWLWSSDDEEKDFHKDSLSLETKDEWSSGKMINFVDVTNITQSFDNITQLNSIFQDKKSIKTIPEKVVKAKKAKKQEKTKKRKSKIQKKKRKKTKRKTTKKPKTKRKIGTKIKDFYKVKEPIEFETIFLTRNKKKIPFRCYPGDSLVLKFSRKSQRTRLIEKEIDDDDKTDDEILEDSIDYMLEKLKMGIKKVTK
jgi:hypothetical protein